MIGLGRQRRLWWVLVLLLLAPRQGASRSGQPVQPGQPVQADQEVDTAREPVPPPEEAVGPRPIPQANIPARAEEANANLRRVQAVLEPDNEVQAIEVLIDQQAARLVEMRARLDAIDENRVSNARIEDSRIEWRDLQSVLDGWMAHLEARWRELQDVRGELVDTRQQWQLTGELAVEQEAPLELLQLAGTLLQAIDAILEQLDERRDAVAAVLEQVARARETVAESLVRLNEIATAIRRRIFTRDAPPLWSLGTSGEGATISEDIREGTEHWWEGLTRFAQQNRERLYHFSMFLAFYLATALWLGRWSRSWPPNDPEIEAARFVVSRPFSTSIALTLATISLFMRNTAASVQDIIAIVALIPILRLGDGLLTSRARLALYAAPGLYVLDTLWLIAPDGSLLRRIGHLVANAVALTVAMLLLSYWRRHVDLRSWRWRLVLAGVSVASVVLSATLLANIFGWLTLAQNASEAMVVNAYSALAWVVVVKAAGSLVVLIPRSFIGQLLISVRRNATQFVRITTFLITAAAVLIWARGALTRIHLFEPFRETLVAALTSSVSIGGLEVSLGRIIAAFSLLFLTWLFARFARFVLREEIFPRFRLPAGADHSVITLGNYVLWGSGVLLAGAAAGLNATQLTVVFGALGVGIGFGLQNIINNFVSGLILIFERPIRVGDRVQTADYMGVVTGIGIRASTIRTYDGAEAVVPNGDLIAKDFINWTHTDEIRRVEVLVHVEYGTDPRQVLEILGRIASEHPSSLDKPAPSAYMIGFGESSLQFRLWVWSRIENFMGMASDLHVSINEELKKAGIKIPLPQRDVKVSPANSSSSEEASKIGFEVE